MNRINIYLFIFIINYLISSLAFAGCGGSCGGGGNTIKFTGQEKPILLDRLSLNPHLAFEIPKNSDKLTYNANSTESTELEIEPLRPEDQYAFDLAFLKLQRWQQQLTDKFQLSKTLLHLIEKSLRQMSYLRTSHAFNLIERYELSDELKNRNPIIETVILFLSTHGAIISSPSWDKLGQETQAGLLIHEALRQIQEGYKFSDLSDEQLQLITAQIMDGDPNVIFSFEIWMSPMLKRFCYLQNVTQRTRNPLALLATNTNMEINDIIDKNQKERKKQLLIENFETQKKIILKDLIDRGILKQ